MSKQCKVKQSLKIHNQVIKRVSNWFNNMMLTKIIILI